MRISELAQRSGLSVPTIKFYVREGVLPPGRATARTQAEYGPGHLDRLRLIRALLDVGRLPLATVREVLGALDRAGDSPGGMAPAELGDVIGTVFEALPGPRTRPVKPGDTGDAGDTADDAGRPRRALAVMAALGWQIDPASPTLLGLEAALASVEAVGQPPSAETLLLYGRAAHEIAAWDIGSLPGSGDPGDVLRHMVVGTVLYEPVLAALRRLALQQIFTNES